jgi:nicotinamide-nucleotide amidase
MGAAPATAALRTCARRCGKELARRELRLVAAESCTGGLFAATCTAIAGSSEWFDGAFVTYRESIKSRVLEVAEATLRRYGAVSEPTVREMAVGALTHSDADFAVSISGVAGPSGGDVDHPVGTVWFAWALRVPDGVRIVQTSCHQLTGNRDQVRRAAVGIALDGVLATLSP